MALMKRGNGDVLDWPDLRSWFGLEAADMRVEEFRENGTLVVRAELPGIDPEKDIEITVADGALRIHAERRESHTEGEEGKAGYRSEFRYGSLDRLLPVPAGTTDENVTASYKDGMLEVRLPVAEGAPAPRRIAVTKD
jgi:HSP20 family protein